MTGLTGLADEALHDALVASQRLGMLGGRPVSEVIEHAGAFVGALADVHGSVVDLGSGGGVPGLVIAAARPDLRLVLVDRRRARTDHLLRLVRRLGVQDRVTVIAADVLVLELPEPADAVVARGFGPPDLTARAAARLLRPGGRLIVSEPPAPSTERWSAATTTFRRLPHPDARVAVLRLDVPRGT